jgi:uncharacterized protein (DUF58 family)
MRKNMGTVDRVIRTIIAVALVALIATGRIAETWAVVATIVAVAFLLTSAVGFCPAYWPFKISSRRESDRETG